MATEKQRQKAASDEIDKMINRLQAMTKTYNKEDDDNKKKKLARAVIALEAGVAERLERLGSQKADLYDLKASGNYFKQAGDIASERLKNYRRAANLYIASAEVYEKAGSLVARSDQPEQEEIYPFFSRVQDPEHGDPRYLAELSRKKARKAIKRATLEVKTEGMDERNKERIRKARGFDVVIFFVLGFLFLFPNITGFGILEEGQISGQIIVPLTGVAFFILGLWKSYFLIQKHRIISSVK